MYCVAHAGCGMTNVWKKECEVDGCDVQANYGKLAGKPTHCVTHGVGMTRIWTRLRCMVDGCTKNRKYGMQTSNVHRCVQGSITDLVRIIATHCGMHGRVLGMVDVVSKKCAAEGCTKRNPSYGHSGEAPTHCPKHGKSLDMMDVKSKKCQVDNCPHQPTYGFPGGKSTNCAGHKLPDMVNVVSPLCASCNITCVFRKGVLCAPCGQFQELGTSHKTRSKERAAIDALRKAELLWIDGVTYTYNKSVGKSCGAYRPDIAAELDTHVVIIEIDEHQHHLIRVVRGVGSTIATYTHEAYTPDCELTRMLNITQAYQKPCHFIRFNPDAFKIDGITSRVPIAARHAALCRQFRAAIDHTPMAILVVTHMFYDHDVDCVRTDTPTLPPGF